VNRVQIGQIKFQLLDESEQFRKFIEEEISRIMPYISQTVKALYNLNWGPDFSNDEYLPQTHIEMELRGIPISDIRARVFSLQFYTDDSERFYIYMNEWGEDRNAVAISIPLSFSDFLEVKP